MILELNIMTAEKYTAKSGRAGYSCRAVDWTQPSSGRTPVIFSLYLPMEQMEALGNPNLPGSVVTVVVSQMAFERDAFSVRCSTFRMGAVASTVAKELAEIERAKTTASK